MIFFQMIKGLCMALGQFWLRLWRSSGKKTRWTLALIVLILVSVFCVKRYHDAFVSEPPAWLQQKDMTSPPLPAAPWEQFKALLDLANRYVNQHGVPLGSVKLWEVQPDLKETILWSTDEFKNPGFNPLTRIERSIYMKPERLIGYYTRTGTPLEYTVRRSPSEPKQLLLTLHMPSPIAPGTTGRFFQLTRQPNLIRQTKDGNQQIWLGRMPGPDTAIHLWAVRLPEHASLVRHSPERGATVSTEPIVQASWANARIDSNATPVSVVFKLPK